DFFFNIYSYSQKNMEIQSTVHASQERVKIWRGNQLMQKKKVSKRNRRIREVEAGVNFS
uniref:Uncharacterized protein n=1 Tax=Sus scrofa TaxID=9823 RepID=A0A8D1XUD5_PIG